MGGLLKVFFLLILLIFFVSVSYAATPSDSPIPSSSTCPNLDQQCNLTRDGDAFCQNAPGCENYVCLQTGAVSRISSYVGYCEPAKGQTCSKFNSLCDSTSDCSNNGEVGCKNYYCWKEGGFSRCEFGAQPTTAPAPTIGPLNPQCPSGDCPSGLGFSLSTDPAKFVQTIFGIILSMAGGIAIILIIMSGYALMFAGGNPEKVQASRDQLTAAIIGLLFIIFSMSILQIVGVDILQIPGLTRTP